MTDHKAIAIFTGLKMMVGTQAKEACDAAISALQERIDREKGCDWCYCLSAVSALHDAIPEANYCPMCGRPLKGEDNGKVD